MRVIPLDGDGWQVRACLGEEWRWYVTPRTPRDAPGWLPARVPGSVIDDLWRAGEVPDPYRGRNSLLLEWVPARAWVYRRWIALPALGDGERAVLCLDGVDHAATVHVDGAAVAYHEGAFVPFEADVTDLLASGGEHLVAVVVHPAPASEPQVGCTSRVTVHKSRMGYGWDFCPRMVHQGVWRPVRLEVGPLPRLAEASVATGLSADLAEGEVTVHAHLHGPGAGRLRVTVADGGREVARDERPVSVGERSRVTMALRLGSPRLWWPNGTGEAHLYRVEVSLHDGGQVASRGFDVGFRRVELHANAGAPADALPYTLVVNGVRRYLKGWNWVPIDALYGVPRPGKLAHLLRLARDAHVNLLRVWGGGLVETPEFYAHCDRLGLLVWQEFSMSSSGIDSVPSQDPAFVQALVDEARSVVPRLRHHPSLAIWCGGNELAADSVPLDDSAPVLAALRKVVAELHPDAAWLPSSPSGPAFLNRLDLIAADPQAQHDVHGPWEHQGLAEHYRLYDAGTCLLHSEFGVEGMTNRRTLDALVPAEQRWPAGRANPVYAHLGAWWNNEPLVQESFGHRLRCLDTLRRASQLLQADGLRYAVEANRRRAPRSSGTIPWQLNEAYPNAWCTAAVDHRGDAKPAYHAVRRAYRPWHVCAQLPRQAWGGYPAFRARVWTWGETARAQVTVVARLVDAAGAVLVERSWRVAVSRGLPVQVGELTADLTALATELFLLDLVCWPDGEPERANRYLLSRTTDLAPLLDLPPATVDTTVARARDAWQVTLTHRGGPAALGLTIEDDRPYSEPGWAVFDDNGIDLLPGESRMVTVDWRDAPPAGRAIRMSGWNIEERRVY